jgi:hypothetical protein
LTSTWVHGYGFYDLPVPGTPNGYDIIPFTYLWVIFCPIPVLLMGFYPPDTRVMGIHCHTYLGPTPRVSGCTGCDETGWTRAPARHPTGRPHVAASQPFPTPPLFFVYASSSPHQIVIVAPFYRHLRHPYHALLSPTFSMHFCARVRLGADGSNRFIVH